MPSSDSYTLPRVLLSWHSLIRQGLGTKDMDERSPFCKGHPRLVWNLIIVPSTYGKHCGFLGASHSWGKMRLAPSSRFLGGSSILLLCQWQENIRQRIVHDKWRPYTLQMQLWPNDPPARSLFLGFAQTWPRALSSPFFLPCSNILSSFPLLPFAFFTMTMLANYSR